MCCISIFALSCANAFADDQRAVLTLRVNMAAKQDATVTIHGADVLVRRGDLRSAGLRGFHLEEGNPADLIALSTLEPGVTFRVDDVALTLDLTVSAAHLETNVIDFGAHQDVTLARPVRSAFLNYSVSDASQTGAAFSGELGTHVGTGMLTSTASYAANQTYRSSVTHWVFDSPRSDKRLTVGDVLTSTGDLGGTVAIAGIGVQRYFGLTPNVVKTVLPNIAGNALTPSTADIYVNGVLLRHEILPPGQFNIENLPMGQGPNNMNVVVTDAFGRQQTYANQFYASDELLARGLTDFSYGAGFLHAQGGQQIGSGPAAAGRYAAGLTDNVTAGGRLEISRSTLSAGPALTFRLPYGVLGAAAAISRSGATGGQAALVSYQYSGPAVAASASIAYQSPHYSSLALEAGSDRPIVNATLGFSKQLTRQTSFGISYSHLRDREVGATSMWEVAQTVALSRDAQLQISQTMTSTPSGRQFGVASSLYFTPRANYDALVTAGESQGRSQATLQVSHQPAAGTPSLAYTAAMTGGSGSASGYLAADYRAQSGDYLANLALGGGQNSYSVTAAGGLVFIGGRLFQTQPVNDAYALVDAGGLSGVRVLANNVVVGRTNKQGLLLVPNLGSYTNNSIAISSSDAPMNYTIDAATQSVAPMYRSGDVVHFGINRVRPVTGNLLVMMDKAPVVPAFGILEIRAQDRTLSSDIGEGGEFYFETLPSGVYSADVRFSGGRCRFALNVPNSTSPFLKMGTVACAHGVHP